ncbi:MAG: hypothetical protein ACLPLP_07445 [Mycobacterium sp.]
MATTIWTLLSIFVIAPLGALAFDRPLFGNWIWHIAPEKVRDYEEHSGVTGKTPHQVSGRSLRGITDADMVGHDVSNAVAMSRAA